MPRYAAFLRAVNVGGTGHLPMIKLRSICEEAGFTDVKTYIASGNVVFTCRDERLKACRLLEQQLAAHAGKAIACFLRDAAELRRVISDNPFPTAESSRLMVILLSDAPAPAMLAGAKGIADEEFSIGPDCLYVHYPSGSGRSKLRIKGAEQGTARNLNTISKMLSLLDG